MGARCTVAEDAVPIVSDNVSSWRGHAGMLLFCYVLRRVRKIAKSDS